ncbi:hypothetical protein D3C73_1216000 [compost metagenome]
MCSTEVSTAGVDGFQCGVDCADSSREVGFSNGAGRTGNGDTGGDTQAHGVELGGQVQSDLVGSASVGANLESHGAGGTVEQVLAVQVGRTGDTGQLGGHLRELFVQSVAVVGAVAVVSGLNSQFTHTLQDVGLFLHRAFSGLGDRDTVVGVFDRHGLTTDLRSHAGSDLQAGGVVFGTVDFQAGRQTGHRSR